MIITMMNMTAIVAMMMMMSKVIIVLQIYKSPVYYKGGKQVE